MSHGAECVVLRIRNKNGFPFVEVTRFFLKRDLQDDRSLTEPDGALQVTFLFFKLCRSLFFFKNVRVQNGALYRSLT